MNFLKILCYLLPLTMYLPALYYYEPFDSESSAVSNGWRMDYKCGRDGFFYPPSGTAATISRVRVTDGALEITGAPNNRILAYNGYWVGNSAVFLASNCASLGSNQIDASPENPFGFQITRLRSIIDPNRLEGTDYLYNQSSINVWLIKNQTLSNEWNQLENFVYFFEKAIDRYDFGGDGTGSTFGLFTGTEVIPDISMLNGFDGTSYDFTSYEVSYDDRDGGDNTFYGSNDPENINSNALGVRFSYDGNLCSVYLNPNPGNLNGTGPDAWYLFSKKEIFWNKNLGVLLGHENLSWNVETAEATWDHFLIRSVTSGAFFDFEKVKTDGQALALKINLRAVFKDTDAGIGEIKIKVSSKYSVDLKYFKLYQNGKVLPVLLRQDCNPPHGGIALCRYPGYIKVRFSKKSAKEHNIIHSDTDVQISVLLRLEKASPLVDEKNLFRFYVNNEKYPDTAPDIITGSGIPYATTGWQKVVYMPKRLSASAR